ncbi:MAG: tRNA1(Val) (adenine(37)-N6)-methyltransferase [Paludibacteraceae bacterium]
MSAPYFRFKQFTVRHDRCAMKVGTDGVLLGAWAGTSESSEEASQPAMTSSIERILDVGTGSGLVALMLAQRFPNALIDGIDIDSSAVLQAQDNFSASPFSTRLRAYSSPLQDWQPQEKYDLIVSNPPYFSNSLLCPDNARTNARHDNTLSFAELFEHSDRLLSPCGTLALVLPADAEKEILALSRLHHLYCVRLCRVHTTAAKPAKRILIAFSRQAKACPLTPETLCLSENGLPRSTAYSALTQEFYL